MANQHDNEILNHIFNPLLPTSPSDIILEDIDKDQEGEILIELETEEVKEFKKLEFEGIKAAETKNLQLALTYFNQGICIAPKSCMASAYNNRAQAYRLLGQINEAKQDLNNAINLSEGKGKASCQAYCQRGLIHLKENQSEDAKKDFEAAAQLGSKFAKAQLVQMNPYAALCNKMLREMFTKVKQGVADDENDENIEDMKENQDDDVKKRIDCKNTTNNEMESKYQNKN